MTNRSDHLSHEFLRACQSGDLPRVETLVSEYCVQDWTIFRHVASGDTALHVAAREGHTNVVRFLCEAFEKPDFRVDVSNKDMKRPLHEAAQFARSSIVEYLIEKGTSQCSTINCGKIMRATSKFDFDKSPLFEGACVDSLKRADWTPLMLACTKTGSKACKCIARLLQAKANIFLRNKDGWGPLHLVCRSGDVNAFNLLTKHSVKCIEDRSNNGRSAMHVAAFHGHEPIIDLLATLNPSLLAARDSSGSTSLLEAIKSGNLSAVKRLISLGADVHATDNVGQTILHIAALAGNIEIIEYILSEKLIDVHSEGLFGVTPLVAARRSNRTNAIECLINHGASK